ncbi:MAG: GNAT family N-acetyltransferase [Planctomycetota bacterium]|jgi:ribosomal protein S18 acetylase RimI-like enzyme|nr:GNAT family N-acetyltransferase [Planctomycetota bacterium]
MIFVLDDWVVKFSPRLLEEMAALWNHNAIGRHSFQVWSREALEGLLIDGKGWGIGAIRAARLPSGELAGWIHVSLSAETHRLRTGVVEMLLVDRRSRRRGLGGRLLAEGLSFLAGQNPPPVLVDALGSWPYGYVYNSLADGSERSGVFLSEPELLRLFRRAGFSAVRRSLIMRADLAVSRPLRLPPDARISCSPRRSRTWLDQVFRGRELWNHNLEFPNGEVLSRAIFSFMKGESQTEGRSIFSLFGVNTPPDRQRRGYARANLANLMAGVAARGGDVLEIHVYTDNEPAITLYRSLGFRQLGETVMLHH